MGKQIYLVLFLMLFFQGCTSISPQKGIGSDGVSSQLDYCKNSYLISQDAIRILNKTHGSLNDPILQITDVMAESSLTMNSDKRQCVLLCKADVIRASGEVDSGFLTYGFSELKNSNCSGVFEDKLVEVVFAVDSIKKGRVEDLDLLINKKEAAFYASNVSGLKAKTQRRKEVSNIRAGQKNTYSEMCIKMAFMQSGERSDYSLDMHKKLNASVLKEKRAKLDVLNDKSILGDPKKAALMIESINARIDFQNALIKASEDCLSEKRAAALRRSSDRYASPPRIVPIEKNAILFENSENSLKLIDRLVEVVQSGGYECQSVSAALPGVVFRGFSLVCDNYAHKYLIKDHGGVWDVVIE